MSIPNYNQQDVIFLYLFIVTDPVHVSGGSSTHHQEHGTVRVHTALDIVNQYSCWLLPWKRWYDECHLFHGRGKGRDFVVV
jgi:hypothetical protein